MRSRVRRWLRRLLLACALALVGGPSLAYAAIWTIPPLHRLVAESVLTSAHRSWAWLFATPAEQRAWDYGYFHTPNIQTVTGLTRVVRPAPGGTRRRATAAGQRPAPNPATPCVGLKPVSGTHYRGWLLSVCDPARVRVAVTRRLGKVGEQTSQLAQGAGAVAAVNGGGFIDPLGRGSGGIVRGVAMAGGRVLPGFVPDRSYYVIGFDRRNRLDVGKWDVAQVLRMGLRDAVSFKPLLVVGGRPMITSGDGGWGIAPRTAIGQRADGTVLFAVIDGRQPASLGATLRQVQDLMLRAGAVTAVNLDGGSSSTLWYRGRVIDHPCCSPNGQRYVPTAWVVMPRPGTPPPRRPGVGARDP